VSDSPALGEGSPRAFVSAGVILAVLAATRSTRRKLGTAYDHKEPRQSDATEIYIRFQTVVLRETGHRSVRVQQRLCSELLHRTISHNCFHWCNAAREH